MKRRVLLIAVCMAVIGTAVSATLYYRNFLQAKAVPDTSQRTYTALFARGEVQIDGLGNDAAWQHAELAGPFVLSTSGESAPLSCTARLTWDSRALYVLFTVVDHDIQSPHTHRDDALYTKDVVEIFLDPDGDERFYYEIEISPNGVLFDALFPSHRNDLNQSKRWNATGLRAETTRTENGWTAELRIPFAAIEHAPNVPPTAGDQWRMNLYRIDSHNEDPGHYTAWTPPLRSDFHALDRFGTLRFVK